MAPIVQVPNAPSFLPSNLQEQWKKTYTDRFAEAKDNEQSDAAAHQSARCEANRVLKVKAPESYAEAKRMPSWQIHGELIEKDGVLRGVTIDGKKFKHAAPKSNGGVASNSDNGGGKPVERMNREELVAHAKSLDVEHADDATKADIIDAINAKKADA